MTTNGQFNDTHGYPIKPTNSMCNMISCLRLKGLCVAQHFLAAQSNFNYCRKVLSMENIFIYKKQ